MALHELERPLRAGARVDAEKASTRTTQPEPVQAVLALQAAAGNAAVSLLLSGPGPLRRLMEGEDDWEPATTTRLTKFSSGRGVTHALAAGMPSATNATAVTVQRAITYGKTKEVDERCLQAFRSLVEGTPFSKRNLVEGAQSLWNLDLRLTNGPGPAGLTYLSTKHPHLVRIAITLAMHQPKREGDRNDLIGQLFSTFLHEWEVHAVNRITAGRPPSEVDQFLEHYALGKGNIESIPRLLKSTQPIPGLDEHALDVAEIRAIALRDHERDVLEHSRPDASDLLWPNRDLKEAWKKTATAHRSKIGSALDGTAFDEEWTYKFQFVDSDLDDLWEHYLDDMVNWAEEGMPGMWEGSQDKAAKSAIDQWLADLDAFMTGAIGTTGGHPAASSSTQDAAPGLEKIYDGYVAHLRKMNSRGKRAARRFLSEGAQKVVRLAPPGDLSSTASPVQGWALSSGSTLPNLSFFGEFGTES